MPTLDEHIIKHRLCLSIKLKKKKLFKAMLGQESASEKYRKQRFLHDRTAGMPRTSCIVIQSVYSYRCTVTLFSDFVSIFCCRKWRRGDSRPRRRPTRSRPLPHFFSSPVSSFAINRRRGISQLPLQSHSSLGRRWVLR